MRFLRRGKDKESEAVAGWPTAEPTNAPQQTQQPDVAAEDPLEGIDMDPASPEEAKLTIKELRIRKKDLQGAKREIAAELADVNAEWRERQAGRYSTVGLGRGTSGRIARSMVQSKRRNEKMGHADEVSRINARKAEIDDLIADVDRAIITLERFVLRG